MTGQSRFQDVCGDTSSECSATSAFALYQEVEPGAGWYDVAHPKADPFPAPYMHGYLTQESVLAALGVPVNFVRTDFLSAFVSPCTYILPWSIPKRVSYIFHLGALVCGQINRNHADCDVYLFRLPAHQPLEMALVKHTTSFMVASSTP